MSSAPTSRSFITHQYDSDHYLPPPGEIILVRLAEDLYGPGSALSTLRGLPSGSNRRNYRLTVVFGTTTYISGSIEFTVFPIPAYSATDPESGLSSTRWLLSQSNDFQKMNIPLPYETPPPTPAPFGNSEVTSAPLHPSFPTPAAFGDPLEVGGWKDRKPSWVVAVPQVVLLKGTTLFRSFDPPAMMSKEELLCLKRYSQMFAQPSDSNTITTSDSPPPPSDGDAARGGSDPSPPDNSVPSSSDLYLQQPEQSNSHGGGYRVTGRSPALQALYASDAVRQALTRFSIRDKAYATVLALDDDEDDDDDENDSEWEDNMDPVTFARYYANTIPQFAKIVQDHDRKARARLDHKITNWTGGVTAESESF